MRDDKRHFLRHRAEIVVILRHRIFLSQRQLRVPICRSSARNVANRTKMAAIGPLELRFAGKLRQAKKNKQSVATQGKSKLR